MSLVVAGRPTNLVVPGETRAVVLEKDVLGVCEELAEKHPNCYIVHMYDSADHAYAIMEQTPEGDELVYRTKELDKRVVKKLDYLLGVPLMERFKLLEKEEQESKRAADEEHMETLYEKMGGPMYTQLAHDGFIDRSISYPKVRGRKWRQ